MQELTYKCFECDHHGYYQDGGLMTREKYTKLTYVSCELGIYNFIGPIGYHELSAHKYNYKAYILYDNKCPLDEQLSFFN